MSQTIRRGGTSARRVAAKAQTARKAQAARARTGSVLDTVMAWVPLSEAQWHRIFLVLILTAAVALLWVVASLAGVPSLAEARVASLTSQAGFEVRRVEVHGVKHINELQIYDRVLGRQAKQAMTRIDLAAIRADLMQLSWVDEARVSRQLPDTLVIDITERKAHAVLKVRNADGSDSFVLIDATGHELQDISATRAKGRLVLAGEGADAKVADLDTLLDAAPALRPQVAEAEWIGYRRWNLTFKTGQTLELPEGAAAAAALTTFARLDGTHQLIGGQVLAFDMRAGDRIYMRRAAGAADAAAALAAAGAVGAVVAAPKPAPTLSVAPKAEKPVEHKAIEHKAVEHKVAGHKTPEHKPIEHKVAEHKTPEHKAVVHKPAEHRSTEHKAVEHKASEHKAAPAHAKTAEKHAHTTKPVGHAHSAKEKP